MSKRWGGEGIVGQAFSLSMRLDKPVRRYLRPMIVFPHAKVNLGLNVVRRRADGYHDIESVLFPIPLCDALEVVVDPALPVNGVVLTRSGLSVPGDPDQDLTMRALRGVQHGRTLPGLRVHLHKAVPMGAGLGGGSSDGTHMLLLLNDLLELGLTPDALRGLAEGLGSDCPFFLDRSPQLAEGRGERLTPVPLDLAGTWLVLVNPGEHVPTAEAYRNAVPTGHRMALADTLRMEPMERWWESVPNVLEPFVLRAWPKVARVKERLLAAGANYCAMSGSGSSVFGLFRHDPGRIEWPGDHRAWTFAL